MAMTVRRLITALKKMPPDARIVVCDHDHNSEAGELNGPPKSVWPASRAMRELGYGVVIHL